MREDDYRSAGQKIHASEEWRMDTLKKMQAELAKREAAHGGASKDGETGNSGISCQETLKRAARAVHIPRRWALGAAAAALLLLVPTGIYAGYLSTAAIPPVSGVSPSPSSVTDRTSGSEPAVAPQQGQPRVQQDTQEDRGSAAGVQPAQNDVQEYCPQTSDGPELSGGAAAGAVQPDGQGGVSQKGGIQFFSAPPGARDGEPAAASCEAPVPAVDAPLDGNNPTAGLAAGQMPKELPVYTEDTGDDAGAYTRLQQLAQLFGREVDSITEDRTDLAGYSALERSAQAGDWTLTQQGACVVITKTDGTALIARPEGKKDGELADYYAQQLSDARVLEADAHSEDARTIRCYALPSAQKPTAAEQLYSYLFESVTLTMDDSGALVSIESSCPVVAKQETVELASLSDARKSLILGKGEKVSGSMLTYIPGGQGIWVPAYRFLISGPDGDTAVELPAAKH